jgi:hypothetical protein
LPLKRSRWSSRNYSVVSGAVFGAIFWAIWHATQGGRRDFASIAGTYAERYELQVDEDVADEARRLVDQTPTGRP